MMNLNKRRVILLILSLLIVFFITRGYLSFFPNTNLNMGSYNIHHLFTGLLLITLGAIPLSIFQGSSRWLDFATVLFGAGLSLALDQWVYLIVTDGSDASYLLPVSLWGGVVMISMAVIYLLLLAGIFVYRQDKRKQQ